MSLSRYLAPAVLAASLGVAAVAAPAPAQAQSSDDLVRVLVSVADVVMRGNQPYYRGGDYGYDDRLIVQRDAYGRPVYYRTVPRSEYYGNSYRGGPPYGNAYGYDRNRGYPVTSTQRTKCNKHGKCKVTYYDRGGYYDDRVVYDRYYNTHDYRSRRVGDVRYWDGRRWRYRDDD